MPFADSESLVRGWLAGKFPTARVVTEIPANVASVAPVIAVTRFGGGDDGRVVDEGNFDIDTLDVSHDGQSARENARGLGELVRAALIWELPGTAVGSALVTSVTTINGPRWVAYDNTELRRFVASYRITIRSVPSEGVQ